jgi:hypothetical protein
MKNLEFQNSGASQAKKDAPGRDNGTVSILGVTRRRVNPIFSQDE